MAQLQDIIAKRKELMGTNSNLSYNDAMAQARQQVAGTTPTVTPVTPTPAPVTPVTPTPTQTPVAITPPVQAQPIQPTTTQPQDNWMGDFSGIQKKTTTPTITQNQVIPGQNPNETRPQLNTDGTQVNPTIEPVKAPVKPTEAPIDYNQGLGREQDIAKNLQTFKDQGMTADAIKNASGYNTASPEKKAQIDGFLTAMSTPIAMDQKDIVKSLIAGVNVPKQSTRAYNNAVVMADEFKRFNGMTDIQLLDNLKQGQIGSEMSSLLSQNPNFAKANEQYKKIQQTNSINRATQMASNAITGKETPVTDDLTKIESKYSVPLGADEKAYTDYVVNNPEVVASATQVKQLTKQIADVTATYTQALKDLKTQYPDMPASALLTLMGSRTGETKSLLDSLDTAKTTAKGDFDLAMKMAEGHYNAASKDIANQQLLSNKEKSMQMEADFAKKQAEAALADPATQIKSTLEEFSKLGVTATGSLPGKVQEAKDWIAKGGTLDGYINQMRKDLMAKEEYKAYVAKQSGTEWQSTSITRYNPSTGANESTPIFYRKKTSGGFEAVDLSGNPIDANLIGGTGGGTPSSTYPATSFTGDTTSYIASKEGFRDKAYQDSAGVWTIGYGTTRINGKPIQPGQTITQSEAQKLLGQDIASHSTWKTLIDPNTLSPAQQTALASFEYNLGPGIWNKSAMNILDMVKSGNLKGASDEMKKYNRAGGKVVQGLVNRRNDEANMLLNSSQNTTTTQQEYSPDKIKSFEAFNGTSFPSDYKTPAQQKQYRDEYNSWRASRPGTKIETGNDILNIKIDKPTEGQSASQSYTSRMLNAVNNLMPLEKKFLDLGIKGQIAQTYLPTLLKSSDQKIMDAEKKNFITAVLRKQSGASIAASEFAGEEMKYFPQPGDSKEVVIAKQNARNAEIKAMLSTAGVDAEGNSLSKYYNPPFITQENIVNNAPVDKITTLKNKYF